MTTPTKPTSKTEDTAAPAPPTKRWKVRLTHPNERRKTVFSSVSESRARRFLSGHYPRGSEAYLESPSGTTEHYEAERTGPYGEDAEQWAPFDPDTYVPPSEAEPPGQSNWADREG